MAVVSTQTVRQHRDDPVARLERNRAEDAQLVQRINAAAGRLHRLWSVDPGDEPERWANRRVNVAALQAEIDALYERRRQLVAERSVLREERTKRESRGAGVWVWPGEVAA